MQVNICMYLTIFWWSSTAPRSKSLLTTFRWPLRLAIINEDHCVDYRHHTKIIVSAKVIPPPRWTMNTFDVMLGSAPLFRRRSTILVLPRSEAHIRAVHPCYEQRKIIIWNWISSICIYLIRIPCINNRYGTRFFLFLKNVFNSFEIVIFDSLNKILHV